MSNWIEHAAARPRADRPRRRRHRTPIRLAAAGAVVLAVAATASPAAAQDDAMQLISGSGDASNVGTDSGASADGSAYVFETAESSAPRFRPRFRGPRRSTRPRNVPGIGDTDGLNDIYRAQGGKITLLTGNNPAASGGADVYLDATSADDSRVIFETSENVPGTGDTDDLVDVYEAEGGRINLLSGSNRRAPAARTSSSRTRAPTAGVSSSPRRRTSPLSATPTIWWTSIGRRPEASWTL